jgi:hypothetical protein
MICEKINCCQLFNDKLPIKKGLENTFKKEYCENDKTKCARYIVSTSAGEKNVPNNLYPNMHKIVDVILRGLDK